MVPSTPIWAPETSRHVGESGGGYQLTRDANPYRPSLRASSFNASVVDVNWETETYSSAATHVNREEGVPYSKAPGQISPSGNVIQPYIWWEALVVEPLEQSVGEHHPRAGHNF